jgi:sporadic carbohydrate cluster protein (TIGR04323 family)
MTDDPPYGYRGYIAARPIFGQRTAQHVQNLVIRDYADRKGLAYRLSATEYAMAGCFMQLRLALDELPRLEGLIAFSLFMLPSRPDRRADLFAEILSCGRHIHFALEGMAVRDAGDAALAEDVWRLHLATRNMTAAKAYSRLLPEGVRSPWRE